MVKNYLFFLFSDSQKTFEKLIINSSFRLLEGHTKRITGMCWSNHSEGHLVTVSFDKTAVVCFILAWI